MMFLIKIHINLDLEIFITMKSRRRYLLLYQHDEVQNTEYGDTEYRNLRSKWTRKKGQEKSLSLGIFLTVSKMNSGPITKTGRS